MVHRAVAHVRTGRWRSPYRYVLVDEFQDISQDRADLLKALQGSRSDMRLFAVGDDWPGVELTPGMPVEVFIATTERTLLAYLLQPIREILAHTFRES
jgi:DNA helicase IV